MKWLKDWRELLKLRREHRRLVRRFQMLSKIRGTHVMPELEVPTDWEPPTVAPWPLVSIVCGNVAPEILKDGPVTVCLQPPEHTGNHVNGYTQWTWYDDGSVRSTGGRITKEEYDLIREARTTLRRRHGDS